METVDAARESRYLKVFITKWINKLTNVNHIKFGKVFFLGKRTGPSLDDNIKTLLAIATLV